jgi:FKBP-type peptidyl-prolyl cis-trans isomerase FklB
LLHGLAAFAVLLSLFGCQTQASGPPKLETPEERFSYAIGARLGDDLRGSGHAIDRERVLRGVEDGLDGSAALSKEEIADALKEGVERRQARQQALLEERAQAAERDGRAFLERNRERPGVVVLPSGLQYEVLAEGSGPAPGLEDFVTCNYRGTLLDGTVFDETASLGRPRSFAVSSVIDGFEQALLRMQPGARWKLYVPAELGYGARGAGAKVPPNSTLVLEVELLSVERRPD